MNKTVLITGGSGLIGSHLSEHLTLKGYEVNHLSRSKKGNERYKTFTWNVESGEIESGAIESASFIIHLAGANVAEKRWTDKRKKEILESRTKTGNLIYKKLSEVKHNVKAVVGASGIGIYGVDTGKTVISEDHPSGNDFLADVTKKWEASIEPIQTLGVRIVKIRIGLVLAKEGGALPKLLEPVKFGAGAALGSGTQYYSWIHIVDLCRIFVETLENESLKGSYNAVAPNPVTNKEFTRVLAKVKGMPLILPNVPKFVLKMLLGEMAEVILGGNNVSSAKIQRSGFEFQFEQLENALESLIKR